MLKRLLERFRQDRGLHKATVRVNFSPQNQVTPQITWLSSNSPEADTVPLILLVYARILYELAELNEGRVARELITLEEVGQQFSVTRERIRQIEAKALRKLKHPSRSRKLRSFLDT